MYYRDSYPQLAQALHVFQAKHQEREQFEGCKFVIQVGDITDGYQGDEKRGIQDLVHLSQLWQPAAAKNPSSGSENEKDGRNEEMPPIYHVLGNHCRLISMDVLSSVLHVKPDGWYYSFSPHPGWKMIVLNLAEIWPGAVDAAVKDEAKDWDQAAVRCNTDEGLKAMGNGVASQEQIAWFERELEKAKVQGEYVVVFGHFPLYDGASPASHRCMNYAEVLAKFDLYEDIIVAYINGHDHRGAYGRRKKVHHVTISGMVEATKDTNAYAMIYCGKDEKGVPIMDIRGYGNVSSIRMAKI